MTKKPFNRTKIETLHEQHLLTLHEPKNAAKAERDYLAAVERERRATADMAKLVKMQRTLAVKKRKMLDKQAEVKARMKAELGEMLTEVGNVYAAILKLSVKHTALKEAIGTSAEALLLVNGASPITLNGQSYDFGCYGERVYLVPRGKRGG